MSDKGQQDYQTTPDRTVLWVAGCDNHCPGCHNPETWDPNAGTPFRTTVVDEIDESLSHPYIAGLTVSGGDPFYSENITAVTGILSYIKKRHPDKTIWVYTGYNYEDLKDLPIMEYIDVLVDGRFILELKDITLPYSGSTNQRIIDIPHRPLQPALRLLQARKCQNGRACANPTL